MTLSEALAASEEATGPVNDVLNIDAESREIDLPASESLFGVEGEKDVERKYFRCPKIVGDNIDLSTHQIYVHYTTATTKTGGFDTNKMVGAYRCDDVKDDESGNYITFSWLLSDNVLSQPGFVGFAVFAKYNEGEELKTKWKTQPAIGTVAMTVPDGEVIAEKYPDVINQIFTKLAEMEKGNVSDEAVAAAVSDYMAANPVNVVVDSELNEESTNPIQNKVVAKKFSELSKEIDNLQSGGGTAVSSIEPMEDDIPKVFFDEAIPQTKDNVVTKFRYISKTKDFEGYAEFKAQGNSSMSYPKKNMTVKMYKDEALTEKLKINFKGWGEQGKHVYKANWIDLTHARNIVSARIWAGIVKSRSNYLELPELLRTSPNHGAIDGFPVKVYSQGIYQGRYTLNIPKDAWMANMDDLLDTHCILCSEGYNSGCFRSASMSEWTDEVHNSIPSVISNRWLEIINFVMNSTDEEFKNNLNNYFDVQSLIDYHLYGLASCGLDAYGKNQLYLTYDGQKWFASMYDMDSTWGLYYNGSKFVATDYGRTEYEDFVNERQGNLLYIRLEENFYEELQNRWAELKNGALSIENIINRFERFTDIAPAELVKEDYASTTGNGAFVNIPSKTTNNIQQIRAFALARQAWTDSYIAEFTKIRCTSITLDKTELSLTSEGESQTITATVTPSDTTDTIVWRSDNASIATVVGGVVTAVANGNATITAICGNYSATCDVTVSGINEEPVEIIDYTENAMSPYIADKSLWVNEGLNISTGAVHTSTTDRHTPKFEVQNCAYALTGGQYTKMTMYDPDGNFCGGQQFCSCVIPTGYTVMVCSYFPNGDDTDISGISLKPIDNSDGEYAQIALADLDWAVDGSNISVHYDTKIDSANYPVWFTYISTTNKNVFLYRDKKLLTTAFGTNVDEAKAYFAEKNMTLILNERNK